VIDPDGYRPNVGIVLLKDDGRVFWARRVGRDGWQFPQGGMRSDETPIEAMYRELEEETGLRPQHVEVLGATPGWLRYRLPQRFVRHHERPVCIGQKQVWFLLRMLGEETAFRLDAHEHPCAAGRGQLQRVPARATLGRRAGRRRLNHCFHSKSPLPASSSRRKPGPSAFALPER